MVTTWRVSPLSSLTVTANCRGSPPAVCRTSIIAKPPCARAVYSWPRILRQSRHATAPQAAQTDPPHEPRDIERRRDDAHPVGDDLGGDKDRVHGWQLLGWTHFFHSGHRTCERAGRGPLPSRRIRLHRIDTGGRNFFQPVRLVPALGITGCA